ncbi:MAG: hypothetical protein CMI54_07365 [Parcubacteria group bacterium]|nr:hypothetical protein [Parcubacteria group bacterium]|tara:strand:- start:4342 stop:4554 length:213 start_codon:yes stop_codon:yes gene_type:complete
MKINLGEIFVSWFESTNQHLYKKKLKKPQIRKEVEEYVNDVLLEHIETMQGWNASYDDEDDAPDSGFIEE